MIDAPRNGGVRELSPKKSSVQRALRLAFKLLSCLALTFFVGRWGWGRYAEARLERELARYRVAGEIIDPSDFDTPAPSDAHNAAIDLLAAAPLIDGRDQDWKVLIYGQLALPLDEPEVAAVAAVMRRSRDALRRLDAAMAKPVLYVTDAYNGPTSTSSPQWESLQGRMQTLLRAAALRSHQSGDDREALLRVRQLHQIAAFADQVPGLDAHGFAGGTRSTACDILLHVAPDLRLGSDTSGGVSPAEVRRIIDELSDDDAWRRALLHSLRGARVGAWDRARSFASGGALYGNAASDRCCAMPWYGDVAVRVAQWTMRPVTLNDAPIALDYYSRLIEAAATTSDWPAFSRLVPDLGQPRAVRDYPLLHPIANALTAGGERALERHFRVLTERHLATTVLAIRLFAADHAGKLPSELDELVPEYLPAIPTDPMAQGGRRFGYRPVGPDPILYGVGEDGWDRDGDESPRFGDRVYRSGYLAEWQTIDLVIHLVRQPRVRPD